MTMLVSALWTLGIWLLTAFYFLAIISIIATIHELGHYLLCKLLDVRVDEFSVGFGKLIWGRKIGETDYSIRAIPFAAYVRPAGMSEEDASEEGYVDPGERGFNRKSSPAKYAILFAGPIANIVSTVAFFTILYAAVGEAQTTIEVAKVGDKSPAVRAGIQQGDVILSIGEMNPIKNHQKAILYIRKNPGHELAVSLRRSGQLLQLKVTPDGSTGEGLIGIHCKAFKLSDTLIALPVKDAFGVALEETWGYVTYAYSQALGMLKGAFTKREIPQEIGGPVSIVGAVGSVVKRGASIGDLLYMLALLSMAIGVFNLLPVPALDGGRILVLLIRDILDFGYLVIFWRRPDRTVFSHRIEELVHVAGFVGLLCLLVLVTYKDVKDLMTPPKPTMPTFSPAPSPSPSVRR